MSRVQLNEVVLTGGTSLSVAKGKTAYVYERGTTTQATLYAAETGEATLTQPLTTNSLGVPVREGTQAWLDPGSYDLKVGSTTSHIELADGDGTVSEGGGGEVTLAELTAGLATKQPLDTDLTKIAELTTTTYGRSLLALANAAAARTSIESPKTSEIAELDISGELTSNSDERVPSVKATRTYVAAHAGEGGGEPGPEGPSGNAVIVASPTGTAATDTAAVNTAIAALTSTTKEIRFKAGTYVLTPGEPMATLAAGTKLVGAGRAATFLKIANSPATPSRFFDIGGGRVEFHHLCFQRPTTFGGQKTITAIRTNNVAGIEVIIRNCAFKGVNQSLLGYDGVSQLFDVADTEFDGEDVGKSAGEGQENMICCNMPVAAPGVIFRNVRMRRYGSNTAGGSNFCHCIYIREETPLLVDGCRFEEHWEGRYIQVNGEAAGAPTAGKYWIVTDSFFGKQSQSANTAMHTSPKIRATIANCQFATDRTSIWPKGDALIEGCSFKGGTGGNWTIEIYEVFPEINVSIRDCVFEGSQLIDVYVAAPNCEVLVDGCEFRGSASLAHIHHNAGMTGNEIRVKNCLFKPASGANAIQTDSSGTLKLLELMSNSFYGGARAVYVQSGSTVTLLNWLGNTTYSQTTAVITKSGTVTTENLRGNGPGLTNTLN